MLQPYNRIRLSLSAVNRNRNFTEWFSFNGIAFSILPPCSVVPWNLKTWHRFFYKSSLLLIIITDFTWKVDRYKNLPICSPTHRKIYQRFHILPTFSFKGRDRYKATFNRRSFLCPTKRRRRRSVVL